MRGWRMMEIAHLETLLDVLDEHFAIGGEAIHSEDSFIGPTFPNPQLHQASAN